MLGVCCASPISEEKEFIARLETMGDHLDYIEEPGEVLLQETVFDLGAFFESLLDDIFHGVKILYLLPFPVKNGFPLTLPLSPTRLRRKSVHGSTGSPRTDYGILKIK
jgi:hypothetical protein